MFWMLNSNINIVGNGRQDTSFHSVLNYPVLQSYVANSPKVTIQVPYTDFIPASTDTREAIKWQSLNNNEVSSKLRQIQPLIPSPRLSLVVQTCSFALALFSEQLR
jgi:hypothetical protein